MMASQVVGYVEEPLKTRIRRVKQADRRYTESRIIEEALTDFLPKLERKILPTPLTPVKVKHS